MKKTLPIFFLLFPSLFFSQEAEPKPFSVEADYFYGSILEHNTNISHLITDHPQGFVLTYNRKTYGANEWEQRYNYPDWGFTLAYQDMQNEFLGENIAAYGHLNFYFLNRHLVLRLGQGIAYSTNPYDRETNYNNVAYGSHLLATTFFKANYVRENIWKGLGFHVGFGVFHYSNGNLHAPNTSTNTLIFNAGLSYLFDEENFPEYVPLADVPSSDYAEPLKYTFVFRAGMNESDVIGMGQYPFYVLSAYADKRINYKSSFQAGIDVFFSTFLKELIYYRSVAYPEDKLSGDEDYKRVGVFVGHELRFNKIAVMTQLGYYVYWPYEFENRVYNRLGLKRYVFKDKMFATVGVKAHWAKAEAVEFGIGIKI